MNTIPVVISLIALTVSIISLVVSVRRAAVDRLLQLEQLRGELRFRLTANALTVSELGEQLIRLAKKLLESYQMRHNDHLTQKAEECIEASKYLLELSRHMVGMRADLEGFRFPSEDVNFAIVKLTAIKSDIKDFEVVLERLPKAVQDENFKEAISIANGLLNRLIGQSNTEILKVW